MASEKSLQSDLDQLENLHGMVTVFQEVSASNIKDSRDTILKQREFIVGLNDIHKIIQLLHKDERKTEEKQEAAVFISANAYLSGSIIYETFKLYKDYVDQHPQMNRLIFGRVGTQLANQANLKNVQTFEMADDRIDFTTLAPAIEVLIQYDTIHMFYGLFHSLGRQEPTHTSLMDSLEVSPEVLENVDRYVIEPSKEELEQVFKQELIILLLSQLMKEAGLGKQGSRFKQLDSAVLKIADEIKSSKTSLLNLRKEKEDKQQLTKVSRIMAFRR